MSTAKPAQAPPMSREWGYKIGKSKRVHILEDAYNEADVYLYLQEGARLSSHTYKIVSRYVTKWELEGTT